MYRRQPDRYNGSVWWDIAADVLGALFDMGIQLFAVLFLGAAIVSTLRGDRGDLVGRSLMFLGGLLLMALLVSRIVRTTYVTSTRHVRLTVNTLSVPHFVADLGWLALGLKWLHSSLTTPDRAQPPDPAFYHGDPAVVLGIATVLFCLRIWTRVRT